MGFKKFSKMKKAFLNFLPDELREDFNIFTVANKRTMLWTSNLFVTYKKEPILICHSGYISYYNNPNNPNMDSFEHLFLECLNKKHYDFDSSDNYLKRFFAVLDKRTGKRTLESWKDAFLCSVRDKCFWLEKAYRIRFQQMGIQINEDAADLLHIL